MELGGSVGGCFYLGDANSTPYANTSAMASVIARYVFNPRMVLKANLAYGHIKGDTGNDFFPADALSQTAEGGAASKIDFTRNIIDLGVQFEFNFWGYGNYRGYDGFSRLTPYMLMGAGVTIAPGGVSTDAGFNIPIGLGLKYKIKKRLNIGFEWSIRFTTTDRLDVSGVNGVSLEDPYGISSGGFKNKDCYSFTMVTLTYDLFPRCINCNNIKYVNQ